MEFIFLRKKIFFTEKKCVHKWCGFDAIKICAFISSSSVWKSVSTDPCCLWLNIAIGSLHWWVLLWLMSPIAEAAYSTPVFARMTAMAWHERSLRRFLFSLRSRTLFSSNVTTPLLTARLEAVLSLAYSSKSPMQHLFYKSHDWFLYLFLEAPKGLSPCYSSPYISTFSILSSLIQWTCPEHLRRFSIIWDSIPLAWHLSRIPVFGIFCYEVTPQMCLRHHQWKMSRVFMSFCNNSEF